MRRKLVAGILTAALFFSVALVSSTGFGSVVAQGGGEDDLPACTSEDFTPLRELVSGMMGLLDDQTAYAPEVFLPWWTQVRALTPPECAEGRVTYLQLRTAADELLIGALLLERDPAQVAEAVQAINGGLDALVSLRFALNVTATAGGGTPAETSPGGLTADGVLAALDAAGLPFADVMRDAGPAGRGAPETEAERITFTLPDVFDGGVGQLLVFDDRAGLNAWVAYLYGLDEGPRGTVYIHQNVILQLDGGLPDSIAIAFRAVLDGLPQARSAARLRFPPQGGNDQMTLRTRLRLCYGALGLNFALWLYIAVGVMPASAGYQGYLFLKLQLILEPLAFLVWLIAVWRRVRVLYLFGLPFMLINAVLSLLGRFGGFDLIFLVLSLISFASLAAIWPVFMRRAASAA